MYLCRGGQKVKELASIYYIKFYYNCAETNLLLQKLTDTGIEAELKNKTTCIINVHDQISFLVLYVLLPRIPRL